MIDIFLSYSHRDAELRDELEVHLAILKRQGLVRLWHDRRIPPGKDIRHEIDAHLESADVILLLVSPYFLASDYCYDVEMTRAFARHEAGEAIVIPVILEACDWKSTPFGGLRATPEDGRPISKFGNMHDAFLQVTSDIRWAAEQLGKAEQKAMEPVDAQQVKTDAAVRTSNLRLRKDFSDRDRDLFRDEALDYIATFFENSLAELTARNPGIEYRFRRPGDDEFAVAIYVEGEKRTSCRIWLPHRDAFGGDVAYASTDTGRGGSFNDSMQIEDDGYRLGFRPLGLAYMGQRSDELLTPHGAAEYFWSVLIAPLQ